MARLQGDAPICADLPAPYSLEKINPKITFYVKRNNKTEEILSLDFTWEDDNIRHDQFFQDLSIFDNRVILITHGFGSGGEEDWVTEMRDALLNVETQVVAIVDWKDGARFVVPEIADLLKTVPKKKLATGLAVACVSYTFVLPIVANFVIIGSMVAYKQAAANCLVIGGWVGQIAVWLKRRMTGKKKFLWGVGHSLGAHLMGMAGFVGNFDRITGLDPAGPGFQTKLKGYRRLCQSDAVMVDVIHTDARRLESDIRLPYYGTIIPLGTIDFYPNYGFGTKRDAYGNHILAYELFTWSINNQGKFKTRHELETKGAIVIFPFRVKVKACKAFKKPSGLEAEMGYFANKVSAQVGNWYVPINRDQPFAPVVK